MDWSNPAKRGQDFTRLAGRHALSGTKQPGIGGKRANGKGDAWFQDGAARRGSKSNRRKMASAMIAKIPEPLCRHIAAVYRPSLTAPVAVAKAGDVAQTAPPPKLRVLHPISLGAVGSGAA